MELLVEQLWGPAMQTGDVRIGSGHPPAGWREHESYWTFPSASGARLFLPRGPRSVTRAAALNYHGLRRPLKNLGRQAIGAAARGGLPLGGRLGVWVKDCNRDAATTLPLSVLADALHVPRLYASFGVRRGANRKATLHLLDTSGVPVGFAKFGWGPVTDRFVRAEAQALREVGGRRGPARAPALVSEVRPPRALGGDHRAVADVCPRGTELRPGATNAPGALCPDARGPARQRWHGPDTSVSSATGSRRCPRTEPPR